MKTTAAVAFAACLSAGCVVPVVDPGPVYGPPPLYGAGPVYGRVEVGNYPPPVVYSQPVIVAPPRVAAPPVYLHVPPDHHRDWHRHCGRYNACDRPAYFVREPRPAPAAPAYRSEPGWRGDRDEGRRRDHEHGRDRDRDERRRLPAPPRQGDPGIR